MTNTAIFGDFLLLLNLGFIMSVIKTGENGIFVNKSQDCVEKTHKSKQKKQKNKTSIKITIGINVHILSIFSQ